MAILKFVDTHNMVAFLSKPAESDGFKQIVDFLNAHPIKSKLSMGEVQLHALVDGKKIIIIKSTIRRDLQLEDAEGVDCLPNSTIFEQLALMGPKTTSWNEFSSTIASAIICLATNQNFNFSKFIFESIVRNLDNLKPKRKDTQVPQPSDPSENIVDDAIHKESGDSLVRAATTASSLEAEQDSGNITKTRSKATPNESSSIGTTLGGGPRCQEPTGDTTARTRLNVMNIMELCTTLQTRVLDLEKTKTTQGNEIASLKRRVKKHEKKRSSRTHKLKRLYKVGLTARVESSGDKESLGQNENVVEEVVDVAQVSTTATTVTLTTEEITLAQALEALKTSKPRDKGKGIMIEEPVKLMKKKVQIMLDEEVASNKDYADHLIGMKRLQSQELESSDAEKATLFQQLLEKRRKHFAAKREEEQRNNNQHNSTEKDNASKRVNTFKDFRTELVEGKEKRAGKELIQESSKKQKVDDDKETAELKQCLEIILDEEEVTINVIPFGCLILQGLFD
ncbi:hypothetical protein Tco_0648890 [Tanacetum coccineum]